MLDIAGRDTICALATAYAHSAIGVIRVSGPQSQAIREKIFFPAKSKQKDFVATFGEIRDLSGAPMDECLCTSFPSKRSYTGEASFELSIHGNPQIADSILTLLQTHGCRLAEPGEFTFRAVANGKIDLSQAEAVETLIHAQTEVGRQIALKNLKGDLGQYLEPSRAAIINILAELEARLDFPDEEIGQADQSRILNDLRKIQATLNTLVCKSNLGKRVSEGVRIVLYGLPNAGKSTLLNAFVGAEKAIVHHLPGTTRDVLESQTIIEQMPVTLVDVAGIRHSPEMGEVESLGVERAISEFKKADLILHLTDVSQPKIIPFSFPESTTPMVKVGSKSDLGVSQDVQVENLDVVISAQTKSGMLELRQKIGELLLGQVPSTSDSYLTKERQIKEAKTALESTSAAVNNFEAGDDQEVVAFEIREAGAALDRLLGRSLNEDVLDLVFSKFCIGK